MVILMYGKDGYRTVRRRTELRDAFRKKYPDGTIVAIHAGDRRESLPSDIVSAIADDLFSSVKLIDIRGACECSDETQKATVEGLKGITGSVSMLFSETTAPLAKNPLFAYLKKHAGKTEVFDIMNSSDATKFFIAEIKRSSYAVSCAREAAIKAVSACESDSARLSSLAETLVSYRESGEITVADIALFTEENPIEKVFDALDALLVGNRGRAASMLLREARNGGGVPKVFGLLAWQMRELFKVRGEYDRGNIRADDIARATGMKPYLVGKLLSRMDAFPFARLKSGFSLLASLDADMKTGRMGDELALTLFVEKL
ncbi:MAG: hypothetical protein HGA31_00330 [Candidatus Moranbacteria bacterium]|nr:hypothetical protein [Candidatus Moranbacteria bacterium]